MPQLDELGFVLAPTFRSRAYVQYFVEQGLKPHSAFIIPGEEWDWDGPDAVEVALPDRKEPFTFRPSEPARITAERAEWNLIDLANEDINSPECIAQFAVSHATVLIYSGLSKALIKQNTLDAGVRFLHAHGGYLPEYRGATGFYYGLLDRCLLGVTAIWLDAGVDTGEMIARRWYEPIIGVDVDYVQDPVVRAHLLAGVIYDRLDSGDYPLIKEDGNYPLHFVIHPVLKYLALETVRS